MSLYRKDSGPYKPKPTPFGGFIDGAPATTGPHLLVSGPSGVGKSRRVLGPGILSWQGPVVAISSKPDLIDLTLEQRLDWDGAGRTYVLDLSGEVPDAVLPPGATKVVVDPVALITSDDDAVDMAALLMKAGSAGASGLATGGSSGEGAMWETLANAPLAGILRAAGADGVSWARAAVGRVQPPTEDDEATPCWVNAVGRLERLGCEMLAEELEAAASLEDKMRDSVGITMKQGLAPWTRSTVVGRPGQSAFRPSMLEHPRSTLYVVAPATGVAAGAAVAVVDAITAHWRASQTAPEPLAHLLIVADELCNTLPWAKLPTVVTEARAMGVAVLAAMQATSQFARRYGEAGMRELREVFPAMLVLTGAPEREILETAAWAHGRTEQHKVSTDHQGRQSQSAELVDVFAGSDLLPQDIDHGRLLRGSRPGDDSPAVREAGLLVDLYDISTIPFKTAAA